MSDGVPAWHVTLNALMDAGHAPVTYGDAFKLFIAASPRSDAHACAFRCMRVAMEHGAWRAPIWNTNDN